MNQVFFEAVAGQQLEFLGKIGFLHQKHFRGVLQGDAFIATWSKNPSGAENAQIVKVSVGTEETGYSFLDVFETTENTVSFQLPKGTAGKNVKIEVISYKDGKAVSTSDYVTEDVIQKVEEVVQSVIISDAVHGEKAFSANVSYVGETDGFIMVATYTNSNELVTVNAFELAKDGTVSPVSISADGAAYAKVFVFDGANITVSNVRPLCSSVEIR